MMYSQKTLAQHCRPQRAPSVVLVRAVAQVSRLDKHTAAIKTSRRRQCDIIRWNPHEDGLFSEDAGYSKMRKLGHDHFSEVLKLNVKGCPGANFPFHAHGDASLEMQMIGTSRYFFPNQDPVEIHAGDIVDCPKGKDGAHSVESLTEEQGVLVANKEAVFDDMVIAIFDTEGMEKANYSETINGATLEDRIRAASAGSCC